MKLLWIILAIVAGLLLLILLLLLLGKASIRIIHRKKLRVILTVCGIPFPLLSEKKEKEPHLRRCQNPNRIWKLEQKRAKKAKKKALKKQKRAAEKAAKKKAEQAVSKKAPKPNLRENISMVLALIKELYRQTKGKLNIRVDTLRLAIAAKDAGEAAILYGAAVQGAAYLCQWIEEHFTHIERDMDSMQIYPDFSAQKTEFEIDLSCELRLGSALSIALGMRNAYRREKRIALKKAKRRLAKKFENRMK